MPQNVRKSRRIGRSCITLFIRMSLAGGQFFRKSTYQEGGRQLLFNAMGHNFAIFHSIALAESLMLALKKRYVPHRIPELITILVQTLLFLGLLSRFQKTYLPQNSHSLQFCRRRFRFQLLIKTNKPTLITKHNLFLRSN